MYAPSVVSQSSIWLTRTSKAFEALGRHPTLRASGGSEEGSFGLKTSASNRAADTLFAFY